MGPDRSGVADRARPRFSKSAGSIASRCSRVESPYGGHVEVRKGSFALRFDPLVSAALLTISLPFLILLQRVTPDPRYAAGVLASTEKLPG